jgi:uncharacterized protein YegL
MRRLPIYFILDCSESMIGESLKKMEDGLLGVIRTLRSDPHALESVYISIIAFAGIAKTIVPLVEVASFYMPKLPLGGGTSIGSALTELMQSFDKSLIKTTNESKGDWKPLVFLFTDGRPTDNPQVALNKWTSEYKSKANVFAISLGRSADFEVLKKITDNVLIFEESTDDDFKKFMRWISASVVAQSKSVSAGTQDVNSIIFDENIIQVYKENTEMIDENCVTLVGRCQKSKRPYIIKYEREVAPVSTRDFKFDISTYHLNGCYPLDEDYFSWSDGKVHENTVNTSSLFGSPGCPHCGNMTAFAVCACGKLLCINGAGESNCPWCEKQVYFGESNSSSDGGFDVKRGRG